MTRTKTELYSFFAFILALLLLVEAAANVTIVRANTADTEAAPAPPAAGSIATPSAVTAPVQVSGVKLSRYAAGQIKVTWKKHKKTKYYHVYYSKKKKGKYRLAGVTKKTQYIVKRLKNNTTYYFYVLASEKKTPVSGKPASKKVHIKIKPFQRKTVFAGDSICQGIGYPGWAYPYMSIKGKKRVIAYRGLNTITFHTKRIFQGQTGLQKLISEKPSRVYMMLGMNEIHFRKTGSMIAEYKGMIKAIRKACPDTDIVLCAISPVTRAEKARHPGCWQIPVFNRKLKVLAKKMKTRYLDYTAFLKDSGGYLKAQYSAGDGYHWNSSAYAKFAKVVSRYDKALDK